jgi:hypothetical protein
MFIDGGLVGISFYPTENMVTIFNAEGGIFGTLDFSNLTY